MIKLAIPNKGRIAKAIRALLEKTGLEIPENGRKLFVNTNNPGIQIVYARAADIPLYVESRAADIGITGEDMVEESGAQVKRWLPLEIGRCQVAVAAPLQSGIRSPKDYPKTIRVATKLPQIAQRYFKSKGIDCKTIRLSGATELAPSLGIADVIVDQVSTGTTLAANGLDLVDTIMESQLCLIANERSLVEKQTEMEELKLAIESVVTAQNKRYVMMNVVGKGALDQVVKVLPSMESPTVLPLAKADEYAVHAVVDANALIPLIRKLRQAGARDILVMNMSRVVE